MHSRLIALDAKLTKATEFAYGDNYIKSQRHIAGPREIEQGLLKRMKLAHVMRAGRKMIDPASVGGVVSRNRIAATIAMGRSSPGYGIGGRGTGIRGAIARANGQ